MRGLHSWSRGIPIPVQNQKIKCLATSIQTNPVGIETMNIIYDMYDLTFMNFQEIEKAHEG